MGTRAATAVSVGSMVAVSTVVGSMVVASAATEDHPNGRPDTPKGRT
jgi:hypothetical protein